MGFADHSPRRLGASFAQALSYSLLSAEGPRRDFDGDRES